MNRHRMSNATERRFYRVVAFLVCMFVVVYLTVVRPDAINPAVVGLIVVLCGGAIASASPRTPPERSTDETPREPPAGRDPSADAIDAARALVEEGMARIRDVLGREHEEENGDGGGSVRRSRLSARHLAAALAG